MLGLNLKTNNLGIMISLYEVISGCKCGCDKKLTVKEGTTLSEGLSYHVREQKPLHENIYRPESNNFYSLFTEARALYKQGLIEVGQIDKELLETQLGEFGFYKGIRVPLDYPLTEDYLILEAEYHGKQVELNKPKRGGKKKFYVFWKDPATGKVKKIAFGMAGGALRAKLNNPKARQAFSKRMNCPQSKPGTPKYYSCRLPRYAKLLGFNTTFTGFW